MTGGGPPDHELGRDRKLRKVLPLAVARKMEDFAAVGTNAG
ncbi:MAG TPA: hypothetical protein VKE40_17935 [Gemmataceae bacterium]|nr:hypothetical protein [Gemmataceae bacterium]